MGIPKIRGTSLGVSIIRTIVYNGSILGSPYFRKVPNCSHTRCWLKVEGMGSGLKGLRGVGFRVLGFRV